MANTYNLIASQTVSTPVTSITFSSIPSTYTDLLLKWSGRDETGASNYSMYCELNGSGGTAYSTNEMYGVGNGFFGNRQTLQPYARVGYSESSNSTANCFSCDELYIPNYTVATNKNILSSFSTTNNSGSANLFIGQNASSWQSTATITQIIIKRSSAINFVANSTFYLYGIKNA